MLRLLLKCDLFRVVQDKDKNMTPPNRYGAVMTVVMYVLLSMLLLGEFSDYLRGHRQCGLAPSAKLTNLSHAEAENLHQLNAVATFPYIPCNRLKSEIIGDDWRVPSEVEGKMRVVRYATPAGVFNHSIVGVMPYAEGQIDAVEMGCTIDISSPLPVLPVQFNIIVDRFDASRPFQLRSDHVIRKFRLGGQDISGLTPQVTTDTTEPISGTKRELVSQSPSPYFFLFYIQYLRTEIVQPNRSPLSGFQHTVQETLIHYHGTGAAPGVYMRLMPSPYSVQCTLEYDNLSHFLVNLCAVVGGVYTAFSFIELAIETVARMRRQRERAYQNALNTEKAEKQKLVDQFMRTI